MEARCTVKSSLEYGGWRLKLDLDLELAPLTILIGPNLAGKSLILCAVAEAASGKPHRRCPRLGPECVGVSGEVLFVEAGRAAEGLHEELARRLRRVAETLRQHPS